MVMQRCNVQSNSFRSQTLAVREFPISDLKCGL